MSVDIKELAFKFINSVIKAKLGEEPKIPTDSLFQELNQSEMAKNSIALFSAICDGWIFYSEHHFD
jgi:iron only hydrogenase large subunit-like protein